MVSSQLAGDRNALVDLAGLACSAAEELDLLAQGKTPANGSIKELGQYMRAVMAPVGLEEPDALASMRLTLLRKAMVDGTDSHTELPTLVDVVNRAAEWASRLEAPQGENAQLLEMRDFCLTLSKVLIAESRLRVGAPPPMRYRK